MVSTLDWLRARTDEEIVGLLRTRPDLAVPAPTDLAVLAGRLNTGPSVWRAMEGLDAFAVAVLTALTVADAHSHPATTARVVELLGTGISRSEVTPVLDQLEALALVRRVDAGPSRGARGAKAPGPTFVLPAAVAAALGPHPAGLGASGVLTVDQASDRLAGLAPADRGVLEKLNAGTPRGSMGRSASPVARTIRDLEQADLLRRVDTETVELPREVGLALRGNRPLGQVRTAAPTDGVVDRGVRTVDGTGGGQALAALDRWHRLLDAIGAAPPPQLKSGGLGVRDLRRLARTVGVEEDVAALDLELLAAAGLLGTSDPRTPLRATSRAGGATWGVPSWTPTSLVDAWWSGPEEHAWAVLALTWLDLRRNPGRIGSRDVSGKVVTPLAAEVAWSRGPAERRSVLRELAALPPGSGRGEAGLGELLAWRSPLRPAEHRAAVLSGTLREATSIGIVAFDAVTTAGRALLDGSVEAAAQALSAALPAPVQQFLVQADLTVVAPGRLTPELAARLAESADVESAGSATVFRVTPDSLRRALDRGVSAADLHQLFGTHSATPVPQALTYLIDDVARRYGVLRVGVAATYLRSDDPALIDQAMAATASLAVPLRRLAPTVAISPAAGDELLAALRGAGLDPAAEDAAGTVVDLRPKPLRVAADATPHRGWTEPPMVPAQQLADLVGRMRSADRAAARGERPTDRGPAETVALLSAAVEERGAVWIGYAESDGTTTRRRIEPVNVFDGSLVAFDVLRSKVRVFALHRIVTVDRIPDTGGPASPSA